MDDFFSFEDQDLDLTLLAYDPEAEDRRFRELVGRCDRTREWDVYLRQSQVAATGKRDSYLRDQEKIPTALEECGVPRDMVKARRQDINKSGSLPIASRADLSEIRDRIHEHITGTVVCAEIARLFRDPSLKGPTTFASLCGLRKVKILTTVDDRWTLLDMSDSRDSKTFLQQCIMAAAELASIKARLTKSRLGLLHENPLFWSGSPVGIGYAVTQRRRLADYSYTRRELFVYPLHASVVIQVLEASLRPEIVTWPQLRDYCWDHGIVVPPFEENIRSDVAPKSVLYDKGRGDMNSPQKLTERHIKTILSNVLLLGDRLYGSGRTARYTLAALKKIEEAEGQSLGSKVREHRLPLDLKPVPELTILRTEAEQNLFWEAARKWLPYDLFAVRQARYSIPPKQWPANPHQIAGKPNTGKKAGGTKKHPWAGKVLCYKHGVGEDGWPLHTHLMQFRGDDCVCYKDHRDGGHDQFCSTWGAKKGLAPLLTTHLIARVKDWLEQDHEFLADIAAEGKRAQQRVERLRERLAALQRKLNGALEVYTDLRAPTEGMDPAFTKSQASRYYEKSVRPALAAVQDMERDLAKAETDRLASGAAATEEELRLELSKTVADRSLPPEKLHSLIDLFIDEVGVITHRQCDEAIVVVCWRDRRPPSRRQQDDGLDWIPGHHDVLICWRNFNRDDRAWTPEEDDALRRLWPASSGATYEDIKAALLPGRKWNKIYRQVYKLRLTDGSRSRQWQFAAERSERTLADLNPNLSYMASSNLGLPGLLEWAETGVDWTGSSERVLWTVALDHKGELILSGLTGCVKHWQAYAGWEPPQDFMDRLQMVLLGCRSAPRRRPFLGTPHSPAACAARQRESDSGVCIRSAWRWLLEDVFYPT